MTRLHGPITAARKRVPWLLAAVAVFLIACPTRASAALVFYTTRTGSGSFNSAFPGAPVEDFEGPAPGFYQFTPPLSSTTTVGPYSAGDILPGLQFTTSSGNANSLAATNSFGPPSIALFNQESGTNDLLIVNFTTPVVAAGMDLFVITGSGNSDIDFLVYSGVGGTTLEGSTTVSGIVTGSSTPRFEGVSSTVPITRITVRAFTGSTGRIEGIDNLAFQASSAVPEPTSFHLVVAALLAGFGGHWLRRRRVG